jgi:anti-sigma factor RsiW
MKCEEVQEYLSEYSERLLDAVNSRNVEAHLASCARCAEAFADLTESHSLIAALPLVEPPDDFARRVMARIHKANQPSPWWRRFFVPLPITIPVQATALLLIGVLAVYLIPKEKSPNLPVAPLEATSNNAARFAQQTNDLALKVPSSLSQNSQESPRSVELAPSKSVTIRVAPAPVERQEAKTAKPMAKSQRDTRQSTHTQASVDTSKTDEAAAPTPEAPALRSRPITGAVGVSQRPGAPAISPSLDQLMHERGILAPVPERNLATPAQCLADFELIVQRAALPRQNFRESSEAVRSYSDESRTAAQAPMPVTRWYTVPAERYEQFKNDLMSSLGTIESEKAGGGKQSEAFWPAERVLTVKVTILPPVQNERSR